MPSNIYISNGVKGIDVKSFLNIMATTQAVKLLNENRTIRICHVLYCDLEHIYIYIFKEWRSEKYSCAICFKDRIHISINGWRWAVIFKVTKAPNIFQMWSSNGRFKCVQKFAVKTVVYKPLRAIIITGTLEVFCKVMFIYILSTDIAIMLWWKLHCSSFKFCLSETMHAPCTNWMPMSMIENVSTYAEQKTVSVQKSHPLSTHLLLLRKISLFTAQILFYLRLWRWHMLIYKLVYLSTSVSTYFFIRDSI